MVSTYEYDQFDGDGSLGEDEPSREPIMRQDKPGTRRARLHAASRERAIHGSSIVRNALTITQSDGTDFSVAIRKAQRQNPAVSGFETPTEKRGIVKTRRAQKATRDKLLSEKKRDEVIPAGLVKPFPTRPAKQSKRGTSPSKRHG